VPAHLLQAERRDGLDDGVAVVFRALLDLVGRAVVDSFFFNRYQFLPHLNIRRLFLDHYFDFSIKTIIVFYFFPAIFFARAINVILRPLFHTCNGICLPFVIPFIFDLFAFLSVVRANLG